MSAALVPVTPETASVAASPPPRRDASLLRIDADFLRDPYPHYARLRAAGPIHWSEALFQGAWVVTRHADVEAVLRDPRLSAQRTAGWVKRAGERVPGGPADQGTNLRANDRATELRTFQRLFARAMIFLDAPDHARVRAVLGAGFHPARIRALAPQIDVIAADCIAAALTGAAPACASASAGGAASDARSDRLSGHVSGTAPAAAHATGFDFMAGIARPLPSRVTSMVLGIDPADQDDFIAWSDDIAAFIAAAQPDAAQLRRAHRSLLAVVRYFAGVLEKRRRARGDDLVSLMLAAEAHGLFRSDAELLAQCAMLLLAGHETTRNLLGNGLNALLAHPEQWQRLRADPSQVPTAVRELLRYDSPVQYTGRRVIADMDLCGQWVRRGELVIALIGAANRDPARYAEPDRLDVTRRGLTHLSFGRGVHVCIGAGLALMQAEAVFTRLLDLAPELVRAGPPRWNGNAALRGLASLPLAAPVMRMRVSP